MNKLSAAVVLIAVSILVFGHSGVQCSSMQARNTTELLEGTSL
jgi:hypothetical protein